MIVVVGIWPINNFVGHPHWGRIRWMVRPEDWRSVPFYFDIAVNVGLFYPFGLLLARQFRVAHWLHMASLTGIGLLLSLAIEFSQVYCHNRNPSLIDLATNTLGTALGLLTAARVFSSDRLDSWFPARHSHPTGS